MVGVGEGVLRCGREVTNLLWLAPSVALGRGCCDRCWGKVDVVTLLFAVVREDAMVVVGPSQWGMELVVGE